ncbi:MAG: NADH-quinone oxidoreductase subunit NuoG [Gammaproteobacteria bacterium]|jgi:NADH-quinone oxidoreductase subunit G|nr:NADH-quinone oxidoreductase subunit NuoG [Gammaproteobacteria bacterium]
MTQDATVTIEVDGQLLTARPGQMLIEVTDAAGIPIPRFCYHKKLSVAANCRMCLVEVERAPKPLPACATPVTPGMKVRTRSPIALAAQKGTMEFLLINHPLDCPICDQGGECELQDVALGYGRDVSRFVEQKRVVKDRDIGPLIATDLTRCIHCTRCVRFGAELAGVRELGATGRGEHMQIGTFIARSVDSELSGNVIDLCPVGALTSKPFRYKARAWELVQRDGVAPHDCVGSNVHVHVRRGEVLRVVPRDNEAVNEVWISDRDRYGYEGLGVDRLEHPMVKRDGQWRVVDWQTALTAAASALKAAGAGLRTLVAPSATLEEMYLAQKLTRGLGSPHVDYRLRQVDFRGDAADPALPWLGRPIAALEHSAATLLVGSNVRKDQPLLGLRLRKATLRSGAVGVVNPVDFDFNFPVAARAVVPPSRMLEALAGVAKIVGARVGGTIGALVSGASPDAAERALADLLRRDGDKAVLLGPMAQAHPDYSLLRELAAAVATASGATLGFLAEGANATGAVLAGCLPHRGPAGAPAAAAGEPAAAMLAAPREAVLLVGIEPHLDLADAPAAQAALAGSKAVVALSAFRSSALEQCADVLLPVASFTETSGTYVNCQGDWQSFEGVVAPPGEARPAWKVLRVLANLADVAGFEQDSSEAVRDELRARCVATPPDNALQGTVDGAAVLVPGGGIERVGAVPPYAVDALVRRSAPLQATRDALGAKARIAPSLAARLGVAAGDCVAVGQGGARGVFPVELDPRVPDACVWLPAGVQGTEALGAAFGELTVAKG